MALVREIAPLPLHLLHQSAQHESGGSGVVLLLPCAFQCIHNPACIPA